jgi:hypothetical protein
LSVLQVIGEWNEASVFEHVEFSRRLGESVELELDAEAFMDFLYKTGVMAISPAMLSRMFDRKWNYKGIPLRVVREPKEKTS